MVVDREIDKQMDRIIDIKSLGPTRNREIYMIRNM